MGSFWPACVLVTMFGAGGGKEERCAQSKVRDVFRSVRESYALRCKDCLLVYVAEGALGRVKRLPAVLV